MHDRDMWEVESHLADTRAAVARSSAHIARLRSDLAATQAFVGAIQRDLTALWHRLAEIEHHDFQLQDGAERQRGKG